MSAPPTPAKNAERQKTSTRVTLTLVPAVLSASGESASARSRRPSRLRSIAMNISQTGYALPGLVLALGLLAPQPILFIDEPFEGLDLRQSRDAALALRKHLAPDRTFFLSIHQIAEAAKVCDRFVLLSGGRIVAEGTLDTLTALAQQRAGHDLPSDFEEVFLALT